MSAKPSNGEASVTAFASISVNFNEPVDPQELTTEMLSVTDQSRNNIAGIISAVDNSLLFVPSSPYSDSTTYAVKISEKIKDYSGNPMGTDLELIFSTEPKPMTHGGVAGALTDNSARIFARARREAVISMELSTDPGLTGSLFTEGVRAEASSDFTAIVPVNGLVKDTVYYYSPIIDGVRQNSTPYQHFKTAPQQGSDQSFSFVFGSCQLDGTHSIFSAISEQNDLLMMIHLGDFGYIDSTILDKQRSNYKKQYDPSSSNFFFRNVLSNMSFMRV
jgi:hypothetical protein